MLDVVRRTADCIYTPLTVGGGVRSESDFEALLNAGADKVSLNSSAVASPSLIEACARRWGSQAVVVAIDVKRVFNGRKGISRRDADSAASAPEEPCAWDVLTHGGRVATGLEAVAWARRVSDHGAGEVLLTSMDHDGTLSGYDLPLLRSVTAAVPIPVIASGGAGRLEHLRDGFEQGHASAVLAASIFHDGTHSIAEAKQFLTNCGLAMRPARGPLATRAPRG